MITNWKDVATKIGSLREDCESGGDAYTEAAFEEILGQEWIENTVEHAISFKQGMYVPQ